MPKKLKGGGLVDNEIVYYVVLLFTILTLISHLISGRLYYILIFAIVSVVTYQFTTNKTVIMLSALIVTWVFNMIRGTTEGMTDKKKDKNEKNEKNENTLDALDDEVGDLEKKGSPLHPKKKDEPSHGLEGFNETMEDHAKLLDMANSMQPMMKQLGSIIKNLPDGFMDKALERMKNKI